MNIFADIEKHEIPRMGLHVDPLEMGLIRFFEIYNMPYKCLKLSLKHQNNTFAYN